MFACIPLLLIASLIFTFHILGITVVYAIQTLL